MMHTSRLCTSPSTSATNSKRGGWGQLAAAKPTAAKAFYVAEQSSLEQRAFPSLGQDMHLAVAPAPRPRPQNVRGARPSPSSSAQPLVAVTVTIDEAAIKEAERLSNGGLSISLADAEAVDSTAERLAALQAKKRAKYARDKATKATESGDHARARALNEEAERCGEEAHSLQSLAANRIFLSKNAKLGADRVDLHGLFAEEALARLEHRLRLLTDRLDKMLPTFKLEVITGWGKGQSGRVILRPAVEEYLRLHEFAFVEKFPGHFFVTVRRNSFDQL